MCVAVLQKPGDRIPEKYFDSAARSNSDGFGIMYPHQGGKVVCTYRTLSLDKLKENYTKIYNAIGKTSPIAVHFRASTGGGGIENAHPFRVNSKIAFIHNGVINIKCAEGKSDTRTFNELVLKPLHEDVMHNKTVLGMIEKVSGWSKFVFMNAEGEYTIIREKDGEWEGNCWYSNVYWRYSHNDRWSKYASTNIYGNGKQTSTFSSKNCAHCNRPLTWAENARGDECCYCISKGKKKDDNKTSTTSGLPNNKGALDFITNGDTSGIISADGKSFVGQYLCCSCKSGVQPAAILRVRPRHDDTASIYVCHKCIGNKPLGSILSAVAPENSVGKVATLVLVQRAEK